MPIALTQKRQKEPILKEFSDRQRAREKTLKAPLVAREALLGQPSGVACRTQSRRGRAHGERVERAGAHFGRRVGRRAHLTGQPLRYTLAVAVIAASSCVLVGRQSVGVGVAGAGAAVGSRERDAVLA